MRQQLVKEILKNSGQILVTNLIHSSVFCLHSYMYGGVAEVIFELMLLNRAVSCVALSNIEPILMTSLLHFAGALCLAGNCIEIDAPHECGWTRQCDRKAAGRFS